LVDIWAVEVGKTGEISKLRKKKVRRGTGITMVKYLPGSGGANTEGGAICNHLEKGKKGIQPFDNKGKQKSITNRKAKSPEVDQHRKRQSAIERKRDEKSAGREARASTQNWGRKKAGLKLRCREGRPKLNIPRLPIEAWNKKCQADAVQQRKDTSCHEWHARERVWR